MTESPFLLSSHAYLCVANQHLVFLDLKRNKYLCLDQRNSRAVMPYLFGLSTALQADPQGAHVQESDARKIIASLLSGRLITRDSGCGKTAIPARLELSAQTSLADVSISSAPIRLRHWLTFFTAAGQAAASLRWLSIERTVEQARRRKSRGTASRPANGKGLSNLVAMFNLLRPLFPRKYVCLFDSLALIQFLAHYDYFPTWVFGIRMDPFGAHCWVQDGEMVLNDTVEMVQQFTPIMTI